MDFKCYDCGKTFDEPKLKKEVHGEILAWCPHCGGSFGEAKKCKICGEDFFEEELYGGGVCDECLDGYKKDFGTCYKIADTVEKQEIEINALLASLVDASKIEAVLYHILEQKEYIDCSNFINQDKEAFAEALLKEVEK